MSAQPARPGQQQQARHEDVYRRMWENVDSDWDNWVLEDWRNLEDLEPAEAEATLHELGLFFPEVDDEHRVSGFGSHGGTSASTSARPMGNSSSSSASTAANHTLPHPAPSHSRSLANPAGSDSEPRPSTHEQGVATQLHHNHNRRRLVPDHSDNWLDPTTTHTAHRYGSDNDDDFDHIPDEIFEALPDRFGSDSLTSVRSPSYHPDRDHEEESGQMEGTTRRRGGARGSGSSGGGSGGFVDLTEEQSPPAGMTVRSSRKHGRAQDDEETATRKRTKPSASSRSQPQRTLNIQELDLTSPTENPSAEDELLSHQQTHAIAAQQKSNAPTDTDRPLKMGQRQCIICMEPYTAATVTHCGHIYCHECLWQALKAGEKNSERGVGTCPVCRKVVKKGDKRRGGKGEGFVGVKFMKKSAFHGKGKAARG